MSKFQQVVTRLGLSGSRYEERVLIAISDGLQTALFNDQKALLQLRDLFEYGVISAEQIAALRDIYEDDPAYVALLQYAEEYAIALKTVQDRRRDGLERVLRLGDSSSR